MTAPAGTPPAHPDPEPPAGAGILQAASALRITPVPVGIPYQLGLVVVAGAMLLLPLLYLALIVLLGWGVWWYAVHAVGILTAGWGGGGGAIIWRFVAYIAPLFGGTVGVLFMIKPILARPPTPPPPLVLAREAEPVLYAFVERLCGALGAPVPREVRVDMLVNASASFRRGVGSMLSSDLVLTLGLPLVAGLSVTQLAGVLAHEFGHFSQAAAMRFSYLIGSVNHWFARVVFERDRWDQKLDDARRHDPSTQIQAVLAVVSFFVWLSRRILWLLMYAGHAMSAYLSRQMEYNADRHQVQIVGSPGFREAYLRLQLLQYAMQEALGQVNTLLAEQRLPENVAALTRLFADRLDAQADVHEQLTSVVFNAPTGRFDTHPSGGDRIRAAERLGVVPGMACPEPARVLFQDFDALAIRASAALYRAELGDHAAECVTVPMEAAAAEVSAAERSIHAVRRLLYGGAVLGEGVAPAREQVEAPATVDAGIDAVRAARQRAEALKEVAREAAVHADQAADRAARVADAVVYVRAGLRVPPELKVPSTGLAELREREQAAEQERKDTRTALAPVVAAIQERVAAAASLALHPDVTDRSTAVHDALARYDVLATTLQSLIGHWADLRTLNICARQLVFMVSKGGDQEKNAAFQEVGGEVIKRARRALVSLRDLEAPYPFEHGAGPVPLARYLVPDAPHATLEVVADARGALTRATILYQRCWAELATLVEDVERLVGLEELDLEAHAEAP
jgi:Zn-dependent protease with chaperone function